MTLHFYNSDGSFVKVNEEIVSATYNEEEGNKWATFEAKAGEKYTVKIVGSTATGTGNVTITDKVLTVSENTVEATGEGVTYTFNPTETGKYTLTVSGDLVATIYGRTDKNSADYNKELGVVNGTDGQTSYTLIVTKITEKSGAYYIENGQCIVVISSANGETTGTVTIAKVAEDA
jgi:hypothetical protein